MLLLLLSPVAFAQTGGQSKSSTPRILWEPPNWNFPQNAKVGRKKDILNWVRVSDYKILLDKTAMKDVLGRFGGQIGSKGDASEAVEWLCLHGQNNAERWILWLESGEMNGDSVGSFDWRQISGNEVPDSRCVALTGDAVISLPTPSVTLGAESKVLEVLGAPTIRDNRRFVCWNEHSITANQKDPFVTSNLVIFQLQDGRIWAIQASITTSD